jgi:hypothetical protein
MTRGVVTGPVPDALPQGTGTRIAERADTPTTEAMIPLYHDFNDEAVLVFGGGPVGARKARRFAREASVVLVAPALPADDYGGADAVRAAPGPADVPGWFDRVEPALVVAATDDGDVNGAVARVARDRGLLVNRADEAGSRDAGSVVVPATVRDGGDLDRRGQPRPGQRATEAHRARNRGHRCTGGRDRGGPDGPARSGCRPRPPTGVRRVLGRQRLSRRPR